MANEASNGERRVLRARDEVDGLVRLRAALDHARRLAADSSAPGRHTALVALDGVCEYALFLSVHRHGVKVQGRGFPSMMDALQAALPEWRQDGRRGVIQMHGARNQAQHAASLPDPHDTTGWAEDAEIFVRSLVEAAFDASLDEVLLADAVADDELGSHITHAQRALENDAPKEAFDAAVAAFQEARRRWREQQSDAYDYMPTSLSFLGDPGSIESTERGEDYADVGVFASDLGEYHWLQAMRRQVAAGFPLDAGDAGRTLQFAFGWILRWQRFDAEYPRDRWRDHWQTQRPPTTGAGGFPIIVGTDVLDMVELGNRNRLRLRLRIADVPQAGRGDWGEDVVGVLADVLGRRGLPAACVEAGIREPWIGELSFLTDPALAPDLVGDVLSETVDGMTRTYESRRTETGQRERAAAAAAARFHEIFAAMAPELFGAVSAAHELRPDGEVLALSVEFEGSAEELAQVAAIFAGCGGVLAGSRAAGGTLRFDWFEPTNVAGVLLGDAVSRSVDQVAHLREFANRREAERASFEEELRRALGTVEAESPATAPQSCEAQRHGLG